MHDRPSLTSIPAAKTAATNAYAMAGVSAKDIRIAEVHDCFTIAEVIASEDLGFFAPGEGFKAAEDGMTARNGAKPLSKRHFHFTFGNDLDRARRLIEGLAGG